MARSKGQFQIAANFEVKAAAAFDPRVAVDTKAELIMKDTWPNDGGDPYLYDGLLVSVNEENKVYMLIDKSKALNVDYSGWQEVGGGNVEAVDIGSELDDPVTYATEQYVSNAIMDAIITTINASY